MSKGDKPRAIIDLLIVGMAIEKLDANAFDMVTSISRRGDTLTTERLLQLLKLATRQPLAVPETIPEPEP
ncbi:hypothetical protein CSB62_20220 [Vibrio splendidus]|nr:hypothetical protein BH583_21020 [Vibrio lentus]PHN84234.1 hypothetical protein CSB62_20220 [Vibrio splendidus]PME60693.1 hypothetical protein BCV33_04615 [Vibrio lentus]PMG66787.1 hypothetical protein BCU87_04950 [Vibrio lentus]PMI94896.1 hypothetical protein BCU33_15895 [Vibrio lentus]